MKRILIVSFIGFVAFASVISCKKIDTTDIGEDLIPAVDNVTTFDTVMDVVTDNFFLDDSTRVLRAEDHAWGIIENDPEFGKTSAEFFVSFAPTSFGVHPFTKKDSILLVDSVVLMLDFKSIYGDTNSREMVEVHEVSPDSWLLPKFVGYRVDTAADVPYELPVLGSKLIDFTTLNDSVSDIRKRDTLRLKNELRIKLDNSLFTRFVAYDTTDAYKTDSAFRVNFKGLAIKVNQAASTSKRALAYFSPGGTNSALLFYYRVKSPTTSAILDTVVTSFVFNAGNYANANIIRRVPGGNYLTTINNAATSEPQIYLQSSPGSFATVKIPNLTSLSNRVIHRAELIFEALPSIQEDIYSKPTSLFLDADDTTNKRIVTFPFDFNYENSFLTTFGGNFSGSRCVFNVSRYVQGIITRGNKEYTFRLSAPYKTRASDYATGLIPATLININPPVASGRVVLAGGNYPDASKRARLRIIYSKL